MFLHPVSGDGGLIYSETFETVLQIVLMKNL